VPNGIDGKWEVVFHVIPKNVDSRRGEGGGGISRDIEFPYAGRFRYFSNAAAPESGEN
jgi:hypothetical protein